MRFALSLRHIRNPIRRLSLLAAFSLTAIGLLSSLPASAADFVARDATRYPGNPDLSPYGLKDIVVAYESSLWPVGANRTNPDLNFIRNTYIPKIRKQNPDVVVIDIERWKFTATTTVTEWNANINKLKQVISVFRQEMPNAKIGYYLLFPQRNWLAPCGDPRKIASRTAAWQKQNLRLQPLADVVDIIFPSLYTFYGDSKAIACWPKYAQANIAEARKYGKPVWAFIWMKYHVSRTWIPAAFWRTQLETLHANADGLVIWSMASDGDAWSWTAPWWVETAKFLKAKGLAPLTN
jgi:hypothetical protein